MSISEATLGGWCNQGAMKASEDTYTSIKNALSSYDWPSGMNYDVYLQGSYANTTNIRGDSDVDVVIESSKVFYNNLTAEEKKALNLSAGSYGYSDFRENVVKALRKYYSAASIDNSGDKCVKIAGGSNRLPADVVPCVTYKQYQQLSPIASGITIVTKSGRRIVNYPKLHRQNGHVKNGQAHEMFKPSVRMFKNARNRLPASSNGRTAPSYFLECLIFNVPDKFFAGSLQEIYVYSLDFLAKFADAGGLANVFAQNGQQKLFGDDSTQWNLADATDFVEGCLDL